MAIGCNGMTKGGMGDSGHARPCGVPKVVRISNQFGAKFSTHENGHTHPELLIAAKEQDKGRWVQIGANRLSPMVNHYLLYI